MEELIDGKFDWCNECRGELGTEWVWYVDVGSAHFTFCQDCGHPGDPEDFDRVCRATVVTLTDDRTGEDFDRLLKLPGEWRGDE